MKLYYPITVDLYESSGLKAMDAQQGNIGRGALVTLTANGMLIGLTNEEIEVYAKKPDGTVSWLECAVENGKIKIDFTNQMLMLVGSLQVELRLKTDTEDITTPIFIVNVRKSNVQSAEKSENELPLLDAIKKDIEELKKNGGSGGSAARIGNVTLLADAWEGEGNLFSQIVSIEVSGRSQVDLTPSIEQLAVFYEKDICFVTKNEGGVVTVYCIGQKPQNDYTIQVTITEVVYE